jgi:hypothetical protein
MSEDSALKNLKMPVSKLGWKERRRQFLEKSTQEVKQKEVPNENSGISLEQAIIGITDKKKSGQNQEELVYFFNPNEAINLTKISQLNQMSLNVFLQGYVEYFKHSNEVYLNINVLESIISNPNLDLEWVQNQNKTNFVEEILLTLLERGKGQEKQFLTMLIKQHLSFSVFEFSIALETHKYPFSALTVLLLHNLLS